MRLIKASDYKRMPWKNGGGETAEIDREPAAAENYLWRLSQAWVQSDGPFSMFPGYDRLLMVWQGDGLILNGQHLRPLEPFRFSGDDPVNCRLTGANVIDVGLIFKRKLVSAEMSIVEGRVDLGELGDVHYAFDLLSGDTLKFDEPTQHILGRSLLISIRKI